MVGSGEPGIEGLGRELGVSPFSLKCFILYLVSTLCPVCASLPEYGLLAQFTYV